MFRFSSFLALFPCEENAVVTLLGGIAISALGICHGLVPSHMQHTNWFRNCPSLQAMDSAIAKTLALDDGQSRLESIEKFGAFNEGWQHVVWGPKFQQPKIPMNQSAPCCGFQCQTCEVDPDSKFWCKGPMKEHVRFHPSPK